MPLDNPIHIDTISIEFPIYYFKGAQVQSSINDAFLSLKIVSREQSDQSS